MYLPKPIWSYLMITSTKTFVVYKIQKASMMWRNPNPILAFEHHLVL